MNLVNKNVEKVLILATEYKPSRIKNTHFFQQLSVKYKKKMKKKIH